MTRGRRWIAVVALALGLGACKNGASANPGDNATDAKDGDESPPVGSAMLWPDEDFRYQAPKPGPTPAVEIPKIERFTLRGGIDVYLMRRETLPTIRLTLSIPVGGAADAKRKKGLASMCMSLMGQGTRSLDKLAFEERQADLAANVFAFAGTERSTVGFSSLHRTMEPAMDLMVEMLTSPGMRAKDLERLRSQRQASLTQSKAAPGSLGRRLWNSVVWGPDHAYGRLRTKASTDAVSRADCTKFAKRLSATGTRMFVVGATSEAELRAMLEPKLAKWKGRASRAVKPTPAAPRAGTVFFVDVPGAAQSQVYVGHPGPPRDADDYESTLLMARILGGSFSSRVNMNIRESKGFAYGARATFRYRKHGSAFAATTSVRSDATGASLRELAKEIARMRSERVGDDELERERAGALLAMPARFATAERVMGTYSNLVFYGLPLDWYEGHQKRLRSLGPAEVLASARRHLQQSDYKVLVVGDWKVVGPEIEKIAAEGLFGSGGLVFLDGDGTVIAKP